MPVTKIKPEAKVEAKVDAKVKVNPIAQEAVAKKPDTQPSKIEESKKKTEERKAKDKNRIPTHADLINSMKKQTKRKMMEQGSTYNRTLQSKPKSFPPLVK